MIFFIAPVRAWAEPPILVEDKLILNEYTVNKNLDQFFLTFSNRQVNHPRFSAENGYNSINFRFGYDSEHRIVLEDLSFKVCAESREFTNFIIDSVRFAADVIPSDEDSHRCLKYRSVISDSERWKPEAYFALKKAKEFNFSLFYYYLHAKLSFSFRKKTSDQLHGLSIVLLDIGDA